MPIYALKETIELFPASNSSVIGSWEFRREGKDGLFEDGT